MRPIFSIFLLILSSVSCLFSQQVTSLERVETWEIPFTLVTDSLNVKKEKLQISALLKQPFALSPNTPTISTLQANKGGIFSLKETKYKGQGFLSTYRFVVYTPHYTKITIQAKGTARLSLYHEDRLLGSSLEPTMQDSLPLISVPLDLHAGVSTFYLRTLQLKDDSIAPQISVLVKQKEKASSCALSFNPKTPQLLSPQFMNSGKFLSSVALSPSGKYILAVYYNIEDKRTSYFGRLYNNKGEVLRETKELAFYKWTPSEDRFYYVRNEGKRRALFTSDPLGQNEQMLVACLPEKGQPFLKGNLILIYQTDEGDKKDPKVQFVRDPDDRQKYWRDNRSLYLIHKGTGALSPLTFGKQNIHLSDVSSEGKLLLIRSYTNWYKTPYYFNDLYLFDPSTAQTDTLIKGDVDIRMALFTPQKEEIAILGSPNSLGRIGNTLNGKNLVGNGYEGELFLFNIKSHQAKSLSKEFKPSISSVIGDEKGTLYFACEEGSRVGLYQWTKRCGIRKIPTSESYIKDFSLAKGTGDIAYIGQSETNADRLKKITAKGETVLWDLDAEKMKGILRPVAKDFPFTFKDGTSIDAWYYLPPHFDPSKQYPLLVYYYGGTAPTQRYMEGRWSLPMYAAQGYIVLTLNPSGTTGYGQEFAARHINAWGEPTATEIIACIETFIKEHSFVNKKKIGCFGASYGGFMTQYLVSKTNLFAAAVSHAGISSISNYWGSGYWGIGYSTVASYGSYPWNRKDIYVEQSPLFRADKINTPLLLLHGDSDTNVPTSESVNLYNALKLLGKDVAFIKFTKEDHSIQEIERKLRWTESIMAWFAKYLQDDSSWWETLYGKEEQ